MLSAAAFSLAKEWPKYIPYIGLLIVLMGISLLLGGHFEASTVFSVSPLSWLPALLGLLVFSWYFLSYTRHIANLLGHGRELERDELVLRYVRISVFFLAISVISYLLASYGLPWLALILWFTFFLYPVAVAVDDISEWDNILSTLRGWVTHPSALFEIFIGPTVLLLTAYFLEVWLGWVGYLLSVLLTALVIVPYTVTLIALTYLYRYPLVKKAIEEL